MINLHEMIAYQREMVGPPSIPTNFIGTCWNLLHNSTIVVEIIAESDNQSHFRAVVIRPPGEAGRVYYLDVDDLIPT